MSSRRQRASAGQLLRQQPLVLCAVCLRRGQGTCEARAHRRPVSPRRRRRRQRRRRRRQRRRRRPPRAASGGGSRPRAPRAPPRRATTAGRRTRRRRAARRPRRAAFFGVGGVQGGPGQGNGGPSRAVEGEAERTLHFSDCCFSRSGNKTGRAGRGGAPGDRPPRTHHRARRVAARDACAQQRGHDGDVGRVRRGAPHERVGRHHNGALAAVAQPGVGGLCVFGGGEMGARGCERSSAVAASTSAPALCCCPPPYTPHTESRAVNVAPMHSALSHLSHPALDGAQAVRHCLLSDLVLISLAPRSRVNCLL